MLPKKYFNDSNSIISFYVTSNEDPFKEDAIRSILINDLLQQLGEKLYKEACMLWDAENKSYSMSINWIDNIIAGWYENDAR